MAHLKIDGSVMEGGGQVLRVSAACAVIEQRPLTITKIRAGRTRPGLRPQHLTGLVLLSQLCEGKLLGAQEDSCEVSLTPSSIKAGHYTADTKTAGSVMLILQAVLPCALYATGPTTLNLFGGTDADMAPPVDYTTHVFASVAAKFGMELSISLKSRGFFPRGGGEIEARVKNISGSLRPVDLVDFGEVTSVGGVCVVSSLPGHLADTAIDAAVSAIRRDLAWTANVPVHISREVIPHERSTGKGLGIVLWACTSTGVIVGSNSLAKPGGRGERGTPAHIVGANAADDLVKTIKLGACVDSRMQDQIIILMGLAEGRSKILSGPLTLHTRTAIHIMQQATQAKFTTKEMGGDLVEITCDGIGKKSS
ncbi:RNA 3'-terminal phosphate cyclase type 1 [Trinorchestia longiramus]|nr:RNA 3'-terminal phosphate cyclase type 1 [Trinorchestia longiramus]